MCLQDHSNQPCSHPECMEHYLNAQKLTHQSPLQGVLETLLSGLLLRIPTLNSLFHSTKMLIEKTNELEKHKISLEEIKKPADAQLADKIDYKYKICLSSAPPLQVYKEKGFPISAQVRNLDESPASLKELFKVRLFTNDSPPKPLQLNISSKKILRGTLESVMDDNGNVQFNNIVINEVSSHYIKESFLLIISCELPEVKPLIIENLYVRARNFHKKLKTKL